MPEPSEADRRKAAQLDPAFANARFVDALERGWEIGFRCQYCGAGLNPTDYGYGWTSPVRQTR